MTEDKDQDEDDRKPNEMTPAQKESFKTGMLWLLGFIVVSVIIAGSINPPGAIVVLVIGIAIVYWNAKSS